VAALGAETSELRLRRAGRGNRQIDVDAMRDATRAARRILAPENPLRDLPALLNEVAAVFP
jgi:hypothetical protein